MSTIPEPEPSAAQPPRTPEAAWHVLKLCQACQQFLDNHFDAWGRPYTPDRDRQYRELRRFVLQFLDMFPCFKRVQVPVDALPPTLAHIYHDQSWWEFVGRGELVRFQGNLLTALEVAAIPRPSGTDGVSKPGASRDAHSPADSEPTLGNKQDNKATRRKESRRKQAHSLKLEGKLRKEIATALSVSTRTVDNYLADFERD